MVYADDLIEQAETLAAKDRRRPKQASLRRAVSAAYYALFHEIADRAAASVLSTADAAGAVGQRLRRVIYHSSVLRTSKWFAGTPTAMPAVIQGMRSTVGAAQPPVEPALARVCELFADLQAERHRADYDLSVPFVRAEAVRRIADAKSAITSLRTLQTRGDTLIFFLGCVLGEGLTKNP